MAEARLPTGVSIYCETHGQGEPLVLIPGTGFSCEVWKPFQLPRLSQAFNVILHDPRGCGRSSRIQSHCTIDQMACDVAALLDHLEIDSAHVLGHSMGGRIALALALNFPRKVRSLILASSGSGPAGRIGPDCVPGLPYRLVAELIEKGFEEYIRQEICASDAYFSAGFRARAPHRVREFYDLVWPTHATLHDYLRLCMARHAWEATHRLGDVRVSTLVITGSADTAGSNHVGQSEVLAKRIPKAEYRVLEGQSHGFFWEVPDEVNAWILDWVQSL